jgi:hypothetical protein
VTVRRALELLDLPEPQIRADSIAEAEQSLQTWQALVLRPAWKRAALRVHGDGTREQLVEILAARDVLLGLRVSPRRRRPTSAPSLVLVRTEPDRTRVIDR